MESKTVLSLDACHTELQTKIERETEEQMGGGTVKEKWT